VKILIAIVVSVVVLGGGLAVVVPKFGNRDGGEGEIVRLDKAERGELIETVSAPGQVQAKTKVSISARVSARIVELPHKSGDRVTKGDPDANPPVPPSVLVRLDSKDLEAQLKAAEARYAAQKSQIDVTAARIESQRAMVEARKAEVDDAERDLARQEKLFESKDVAESVVEAAQTRFDQLNGQYLSALQNLEEAKYNLEVQKHQLEAAAAEIARARDQLSYTTITSPIDGVVTKVNSEVGELAVIGTMNNPGTVILEVADLEKMIVNARVDEATVAEVRMGQSAKIRSQAYREKVFDGTVTAVALALTEEQRENLKYYKTEITLKNDPDVQVLSGLTADVDIETQKHADVLKIPSQAVLGRPVDELPLAVRDAPEVDKTRTLATVVYRFADGKALVTPVKIGPSDVTHTIVESGLKEGDVIIAGPYKVLDALKHEQKVRDEKTVTTKPGEEKK
jgi:HlyD family secretion protein